MKNSMSFLGDEKVHETRLLRWTSWNACGWFLFEDSGSVFEVIF